MTIPKFRAYIKATGEMRLVTVLDSWMQVVETVPLKKETKTHYLSKMIAYSFDEIELMQWIGLKDINKVEIYRGDILEGFDEDVQIIGSISWDNIKLTYKFGNFSLSIPEICKYLDKIKIIGNIYQNPEFLS